MKETTKLSTMLAAILALCSTMLITACSDSNDLDVKEKSEGEIKQEAEAQQKEELRKSLLGLQVDLSSNVLGDDDIALWMFNEDGTFEVMNMSSEIKLEEGSEESVEDGGNEAGESTEKDKDPFQEENIIDIYTGKWEVFVNEENPWDSSAERVSGFRATFDKDEEDPDNEEFKMTYYVSTTEDEDGEPVLVMLNDVAISYQVMVEHDDDDVDDNNETRAVTGGFKNDAFERKFKKVANTVSTIKKIVGTTFKTISSANKLEGLSKAECEKFQSEAENALSQMQKDFNAGKTNYAEWMTEIYTKNGKNPRICDMNIPGTHDSFTPYFIEGLRNLEFTFHTVTQVHFIMGQWLSGARMFDFRLRYVEKKDNTPEHMQLYHTFDLSISLERGIQEIVDQLDNHPGETAIACIAFDDKKTDNHLRVTLSTLKKFADKGKIVLNPTPNMKLSDCAGKLIIFYSYEFGDKRNELYGPIVEIKHGNGYSKSNLSFMVDGKVQNVTMTHQNLYEMTSSFTESTENFFKRKKEAFETCFWEFEKIRKNETTVWSWNQVNAYVGSYVTMSYSQNAETMHPWVVNFVLQHKNSPLGIITMDFLGISEKWGIRYTNCYALPRIIVESNRYQ